MSAKAQAGFVTEASRQIVAGGSAGKAAPPEARRCRSPRVPRRFSDKSPRPAFRLRVPSFAFLLSVRAAATASAGGVRAEEAGGERVPRGQGAGALARPLRPGVPRLLGSQAEKRGRQPRGLLPGGGLFASRVVSVEMMPFLSGFLLLSVAASF